jgi:hypothetical protein
VVKGIGLLNQHTSIFVSWVRIPFPPVGRVPPVGAMPPVGGVPPIKAMSLVETSPSLREIVPSLIDSRSEACIQLLYKAFTSRSDSEVVASPR